LRQFEIHPYGFYEDNPYKHERIGFRLDTASLEQCIVEKSNNPYWNSEYYKVKNDLRNPKNIEIKREIFKFFGLDADKSYAENLALQVSRTRGTDHG
jgi:hypothetical protein